MLVVLVLLVVCGARSSLAMNHWVVTEEGKIEYQLASPFNLRQPFNLLAFLQQEDRVSILKELKHDLIAYRTDFEKHSDFPSLDASFWAQDPACRNVKLITLYDLYISTVLPLEHKGISVLDHLDSTLRGIPGEPFCTNSSPLLFSMEALEHLPGMQRRRSLFAPPEKSVLNSVDMRMEVFGSLVHHALEKNATSWVLLDLATLYWRARGNPFQALECIRRALHYSPQYGKDIAFLNLANVLHRSQHSRDAVAPLKAAISLAPRVNILHYALGNIFAALNQLNASVKSFRRCLALDPSSDTVQTAHRAAECALKLDTASREHSRKLELTEKKLDEFYRNMDLVQQHQVASTADELLVGSRKFLGLPFKARKKRSKNSRSGKSSIPTATTPHHRDNSDSSANAGPGVIPPSPSNESQFKLEKALDDATLNNLKETSNLSTSAHSSNGSAADSNGSLREGNSETSRTEVDSLGFSSELLSGDNDTFGNFGNRTKDEERLAEVKVHRPSKLRLILRPLSDAELEQELTAPLTECVTCTSHDSSPDEASSEVCQRYFRNQPPWVAVGETVCSLDSCEASNASIYCTNETEAKMKRFLERKDPEPLNMKVSESDSELQQSNDTSTKIHIPPITSKFSDEEAQSMVSESSKEAVDKYTGLSDALDCALGAASQEKCRKASNQYQRKREDQKVRKQLRELIESDAFPAKLKNNDKKVKKKGRPKIIITNEEEDAVISNEETAKEKKTKKSSESSTKREKASQSDSVATSPTKSTNDIEEDESISSKLQTFATKPDYPESYHKLDFLPYNPLPMQLEELIFPNRSVPLAVFDDPYWPGKTDCLSLVGELRDNPHLASFTGTFLTPEARGVDLQKLFSSVPDAVPSQMQRKKPHCTAIVELPYSMAALDHLHPVMYRTTLRANEENGEKGLWRVLVNSVTGSLTADMPFEESAEKVYAAMLKNGPNWALFNIASLYWRVVGDPANAIECLRRALHFAPNEARDVGYLGLASVLIRHGFLNEAVVAARAALDITISSPVGHYTMASAYLGLRDYVATSLHLRAALHVQPAFEHAHSALRLVRCSLKFREEQVYLRKKMQRTEEELLRKQEEMILATLQETIKSGSDGGKFRHSTAPPIVIENIHPPEIPELKMEEMIASPYTGEDAIRYLTKLALLERGRNKHRESESDKLQRDNGTANAVIGSNGSPNDHTSDKAVPKSDQGSDNTAETSEQNDDQNDDNIVSISEPKDDQNRDEAAAPKPEPKDDQDHAINETKVNETPAIDDSKYDIPMVLHRGIPRNHQGIQNEELKKRFPGTRPWPELDECLQKALPKSVPFTSTLLSVTAKGINVKEHVDFRTPVEHYPLLPYCHNNFPESKKTLVQLTGMEGHPLIQYMAEKGLQEVLCNLDGRRRSLEEVATRIRLALDKNSTSWVLSNLAALYWRITGQGQLAVKCLKHALYYCHDKDRDVALVSLANVLYRLGYDKDAAVAVHMSLELAPTLVVNHFTMANILAAQGLFVEAAGFLESTLHYQPEFEPAADRLRTVRCIILIARHNKEQKLKLQQQQQQEQQEREEREEREGLLDASKLEGA